MIDAIDEAPTIEPKAKVIAQVTFDEEKMREIVKEAVERFKEEYEIEPKRGEWIETEYTGNIYGIYRCQYKCSCCGYVPMYRGEPIVPTTETLIFCPNCGADMRERKESE